MSLRAAVLSFDRSLSASQVARRLGISRNAVIGHRYRASKPAKVRRWGPRPRPSPTCDGLIDLMADGRIRTRGEIRAALAVHERTIQRHLKQAVDTGLLVRVAINLYQDQSE